MFRRSCLPQGAYTNFVKTYNNKIILRYSCIPNLQVLLKICFFLWRCDPMRVMASFLRFLDYTQRRTTVGRTSLDELPARRRDLYLTTHNTHNT